jgi:hypothetical protein
MPPLLKFGYPSLSGKLAPSGKNPGDACEYEP